MKNEVLRMENLTIGETEPYALDGFHFYVFEGEIVNIIGVSGAGKTALYHFFLGNAPIITGRVLFQNQEYKVGMRFGGSQNVVCIGPTTTLVANLSVMENIFILSPKRKVRGILKFGDLKYRARLLLAEYAPEIDPKTLVSQLSVPQRHIVELLRAIENEITLVVIDDCLQSYGLEDILRLFRLLEQMRNRGISILYEGHRLDFMQQMAQRFVVLRKGRNIRTFYPEDLDEDLLSRLMIGNELPRTEIRESKKKDQVVFTCSELQGPRYLQSFSMEVRKGEIVGIYDFNNRANRELMECMIGEIKLEAGQMELSGRRYTPAGIDDAIAHNVGFLPRDMTYVSLVNSMSFQDNLFLPVMKKTSFLKFLNNRSVQAFLGKEYMESIGVEHRYKNLPVKYFDAYIHNSILLTRWKLFKPTMMVCIEPFGKADILMQNIIQKALEELAGEGCAVIISSPDLKELQGICDVIYTLKE